MKVIDRLAKYITHKKLSLNKIEVDAGFSKGYLGKLINSKGSIGADSLENILTMFPDLNPVWLMLGVGDMIITEGRPMVTDDLIRQLELAKVSQNTIELIRLLKENSDMQKVMIDVLRKQIRELGGIPIA